MKPIQILSIVLLTLCALSYKPEKPRTIESLPGNWHSVGVTRNGLDETSKFSFVLELGNDGQQIYSLRADYFNPLTLHQEILNDFGKWEADETTWQLVLSPDITQDTLIFQITSFSEVGAQLGMRTQVVFDELDLLIDFERDF